MVFADPPYNIGIDYGVGAAADRRRLSEYRDWCAAWIINAHDRLVPNGAFWLLINEANADMIGALMTDLVGPRRSRIIWRETFGQYTENNFAIGHRHLFYHVREPKFGDDPDRPMVWNPDPIRVPSQRMLMGDKRAGGSRPPEKQGRVPDDVWEVSRLCGTFKERVDWHPAQLPSMPLERIVNVTSNPNDLVLEPFSGSGSMAIVCKRLGRRYVGIDSNQDFVKRATERLADE